MSHIFALRRTLRIVAATIIVTTATLAIACSDGGKHDSGEQAGDPSTQPNGAVRPDSSTQVPQSPAPGATATGTASATGSATATGTGAPR
jgi:hypothetical protein